MGRRRASLTLPVAVSQREVCTAGARIAWTRAATVPTGSRLSFAASEHTRLSTETRAAEASGAARDHGAGRLATPEEEAAADTNTPSAEAAANEKEMNERGAKQKGEGRV